MIRQQSQQKRKTYQSNKSNNPNTDDKTIVQKSKLQQIFQQYKLNNSTDIGTQKIFQIISLSNELTKDPQNLIIKQNLQQKLQLSQSTIKTQKQQHINQFINYQFDINKFFMMNKSGGLGMIQRKCKFTEKGVLEYENQKSQPKFKQIKGFNNIIERLNSKNNLSKMAWVKEQSKYPFRIVLIDKNKAQKGIYFMKAEQAFITRVYLIQSYRAKINSDKVKQNLINCKEKLTNRICQNFTNNLLQWHKNNKTKIIKNQSSSQKGSNNIKQQQQQMIRNSTYSQKKQNSNQIKLFDNNNLNNRQQKQQQNNNNRGKFDESMFEIDRDSHPLSHYYFNQKKPFSNKNIYVEDSKTQIGFKKTPTKVKQLQNRNIINENNNNKRKFLPYGFGQKLKRYNKANVQQLVEKWQQTIEQMNENLQNNNKDKQINIETDLYSILNDVRENEVKKSSKRDNKRIRNVLMFDSIALSLSTSTLVPFKLQLQVSIQSTKDINQYITYNTFQSTTNKLSSNRNLSYDLLPTISGNNKQNIQLTGKLDRYKLSLRVRQKITDQLLAQKKLLLLTDIKLINGGMFTIQIEGNNNNNNNDIEGNIIDNNNTMNYNNNKVCFYINGCIINQNNDQNGNNNMDMKVNKYNKIENDNVNDMLSKILPYMEMNRNNQIQKIDDNNMDQLTYFNKLFTNIPILQQSLRLQLQQELIQYNNNNKRSNNNIHYILSHIPINELSIINPTDQQFQLLTITYTVLQNANMLNKITIGQQQNALILRKLNNIRLFNNNSNNSKLQLLQVFISVLINWGQMFLDVNNNKNNRLQQQLSKCIGLEENITNIQQKLSLLKVIIQHLLAKQCHQLLTKCKINNIPIAMILIEYCNQMMTRNLQSKLWLIMMIGLYNKNSNNKMMNDIPVQIGLILLTVYICKVSTDSLLLQTCNTISDIKQILQTQLNNQHNSKTINNSNNQSFTHTITLSQSILSYIQTKYQQYFISSISISTINNKQNQDVQIMRNKFYSIESNRLKQNNLQRYQQKTLIANSLLQYIDSSNVHQLLITNTNKSINNTQNNNSNISSSSSAINTINNNSTKCLHIYFTTLPTISGSLYIKTSTTQFQCTQYQTNPYFIVPNIINSSKVKVQFIDSKSNQYSFQLLLHPGFDQFVQQVRNSKSSNKIIFQYWAGLVDIDSGKEQSQKINYNYYNTNCKQLQNKLQSLTTINSIKQHLQKQPQQSPLYQQIQQILLSSTHSHNNNTSFTQQILRKIKILFSQNSNKINQYQLVLYLVGNMKIKLREKIYLLYQYADCIAMEICLARRYHSLRRLMVWEMLNKVMNLSINRLQLEELLKQMDYQWSDSQKPNIYKATFSYCLLINNNKTQQQQISLQQQVYRYLQQRSLLYIQYDIDVEQLIKYLQPIVFSKLSIDNNNNVLLTECKLNIIVSSQGKINKQQYRVVVRNNNKQFIIDDQSYQKYQYQNRLQQIKPRVLRIKGSPSTSIIMNNRQKYTNSNLDTTFSPVKGKSSSNILFNSKYNNNNQSNKKILIQSPSRFNNNNTIEKQQLLSLSNIKQSNNNNNNNRSQLIIQIQNKLLQQQQSYQQFNLIKHLIQKSKRIIRLRYNHNNNNIDIKYNIGNKVMFRHYELFQYMNSKLYCSDSNNELLFNIQEVYYNNVKVVNINSLSFLHSPIYVLHFYTNLNNQLIQYHPSIGIQNNLHNHSILSNNTIKNNNNKITKLYFISTNIKSQHYLQSNYIPAKVIINYQYGIIRWQVCKIIGYFTMKRQSSNYQQHININMKNNTNSNNNKTNKKDKTFYLILLDQKQKLIENKYVQILYNNRQHKQIKNLGTITQKNKEKWQQFII